MQGVRFELTHPLKEAGPEPVAFDQALPPLPVQCFIIAAIF